MAVYLEIHRIIFDLLVALKCYGVLYKKWL
jgi:hypothetical protein